MAFGAGLVDVFVVGAVFGAVFFAGLGFCVAILRGFVGVVFVRGTGLVVDFCVVAGLGVGAVGAFWGFFVGREVAFGLFAGRAVGRDVAGRDVAFLRVDFLSLIVLSVELRRMSFADFGSGFFVK